jgi:hypothetical protein
VSSPFYPPVSRPGDEGPAALGNLLNRVRTLEAVVPPTFTVPDMPFITGESDGVNIASTPITGSPTFVTDFPNGQEQDSSGVFLSDSSGQIFIDNDGGIGIYQMQVDLFWRDVADNTNFSGQIEARLRWQTDNAEGVPTSFGDFAYADGPSRGDDFFYQAFSRLFLLQTFTPQHLQLQLWQSTDAPTNLQVVCHVLVVKLGNPAA